MALIVLDTFAKEGKSGSFFGFLVSMVCFSASHLKREILAFFKKNLP